MARVSNAEKIIAAAMQSMLLMELFILSFQPETKPNRIIQANIGTDKRPNAAVRPSKKGLLPRLVVDTAPTSRNTQIAPHMFMDCRTQCIVNPDSNTITNRHPSQPNISIGVAVSGATPAFVRRCSIVDIIMNKQINIATAISKTQA